MKKNLLLYILLGFLILVNGFFLYKHFGSSDQSEPKSQGPSNFLAKQLDFDTNQLQQFEKLDEVHHMKIRKILGELKESKNLLFSNLSSETLNASEIDSIVKIIGNKHVAKETITFNFFKAVGELCNDNQKEKFRSVIKDGLRGQGPPGRNGPPSEKSRRPGVSGDENRPPPPGN